MAYGIRIRNRTTGSIQIDQNYANLLLIGKTVIVSTTSVLDGGWMYRATLTVTSSTMPLVAVQSLQNVVLYSVANSGTTWTFTYYTTLGGQSVTCFVFGIAPPITTPGWGVRVKKAGAVLYDSRQKPCRIAGFINSSSFTLQNFTYAAGRIYAAVQGSMAKQYDEYLSPSSGGGGGGDGSRERFIGAMGARISSNVVTLAISQIYYSLTPYTGGSSAHTNHTWPNSSFIVLDVTNF